METLTKKQKTFLKKSKKLILENINNFHKSTTNNKKYYLLKDNKKVYFGDKRYEHYYDKLDHYEHLNHSDEKRRLLYWKRHKKDIDTSIKKDDYLTPGILSLLLLW